MKKDHDLHHAHNINLATYLFIYFLAYRPFQLRPQALSGLQHMAGAQTQ